MIVDGTLAACLCSLAITTDRMHVHVLVRCTLYGDNDFLSNAYALFTTPQQAPLE